MDTIVKNTPPFRHQEPRPRIDWDEFYAWANDGAYWEDVDSGQIETKEAFIEKMKTSIAIASDKTLYRSLPSWDEVKDIEDEDEINKAYAPFYAALQEN